MPRLPLVAAFLAVLATAGCSAVGTGLAPGLTARMDQPGAELDRREALAILNHYRAVSGAAPLAPDSALDAEAARLAAAYARSGTAPQRPAGVAAMRVAAGYGNFADTFSGWRNSAADAEVLREPGARRAGIGVSYNADSTYGVHWVLLLGD